MCHLYRLRINTHVLTITMPCFIARQKCAIHFHISTQLCLSTRGEECLVLGGACSRGVPGSGGCLVPGGSGPGGCLLPGGVCSWGGVGIPACTETEPPGRDDYCCGRYASYWNAFLFFLDFYFGIVFMIEILTMKCIQETYAE